MNETQVIRVRFWASARAAAGTDAVDVDVDESMTLAALRTSLAAAHPGSGLADVLAVCSVLVGERPVSSVDPAEVVLHPGDVVEFLPPFAGG